MNQTTKNRKNPKVDTFIDKAGKWQKAYKALREIALDTTLSEDLKWGKPCYSLDGSNVFLMHGFKDFCALLFMKGALLKDPKGILVAQTENTQAARQIRFTSVGEVEALAPEIKACINRAIEVEKAGLTVEFKKTEDFSVPGEFQRKLDEDPELKAAFEALTPGRQRGYLLHFGGAKQSKTRASRVEKCIPRILDGLGLHDR